MAEVRALPPPRERTEAEQFLLEGVTALLEAKSDNDRAVGFALVVIDRDGGTTSRVYRPLVREDEIQGPIHVGKSLFYAWAHRALERHENYGIGEEVLDAHFGPPPEGT